MNKTARKTQFVSQVYTAACLIMLLTCSLTGCTICQDCGDLDYPTYGGAWERTRRDSGRVGSIFDPAGARVAVLSPREVDPSDTSDKSTDASDDPQDRGDASPSDKSPNKDPGSLRDLELEDINTENRELSPSDV